ncbi:MAG: efflux RND transporter periplasmic adaptor subunit [Muribaculaceae bacterium]|nr:efflux RND transporter periplasmic adaptor subunit [Muribaculaceae bacterium]
MKQYIKAAILATITVITAACHHEAHSDKEEHHHESLVLTAYTDSLEYYIQATPFSVGDKSEIEIFLSHEGNGRPLANGKVSVRLGDVAAESGHAHGAGIYHFTVTPTAAGATTLTLACGEQTVSFPVTVYNDDHEAAHAVKPAPKSPLGVVFPKEMGWKVDFATGPVTEQPFGEVLRVMAVAEPAAGTQRTVSAPLAGTLNYTSGNITVGGRVEAGQTIGRIDGSRTATGSLDVAIAEARSAYELARTEYERKQQLADEGIVARSEALRARSDYETAQATYEHLRKGFSGGGTTLTSPVSGWITAVNAANGAHVSEGESVLTISTGREVTLRAEVSPRNAALLSGLSDAVVMLPGGPVSVRETGGRLSASGTLAPGTTLLPVTIQVPGAEQPVAGSYVEVYLQGHGDSALVVPAGALIEEMGQHFVYVQVTPEYFERRQVRVGATDGRMVRIESGLQPGERIVTRGAVMVSLASSTAAVDPHAGHNH